MTKKTHAFLRGNKFMISLLPQQARSAAKTRFHLQIPFAEPLICPILLTKSVWVRCIKNLAFRINSGRIGRTQLTLTGYAKVKESVFLKYIFVNRSGCHT